MTPFEIFRHCMQDDCMDCDDSSNNQVNSKVIKQIDGLGCFWKLVIDNLLGHCESQIDSDRISRSFNYIWRNDESSQLEAHQDLIGNEHGHDVIFLSTFDIKMNASNMVDVVDKILKNFHFWFAETPNC